MTKVVWGMAAATVLMLPIKAAAFGWQRPTWTAASYYAPPVIVVPAYQVLYYTPPPIFILPAAPICAAPFAIPAPIVARPLATPTPAPPSTMPAPAVNPTPMNPAPAPSNSPAPAPIQKSAEPPLNLGPTVKETRAYFNAYVVAPRDAEKPAGENCFVGFWNLSDKDVTVSVGNRRHSLARGKSLKLQLERQFVWRVDNREPQTEQIPAAESGLEIVIRR